MRKKRSTTTKTCEHCGGSYFPLLGHERTQRFCNVTCKGAGLRVPLADRFWAKVNKNGPLITPTFGCCWLWTGALSSNGYGEIHTGGKDGHLAMAPRVAWEFASAVAAGQWDVLHVCDTPACVRNDGFGWYEVAGVLLPRWGHLALGDARDNSRDMVSKGRHYQVARPERLARGERSAKAKLTEGAVREIRRAHAAGEATRTALARQFDVDVSLVCLIIRGRIWRHLL